MPPVSIADPHIDLWGVVGGHQVWLLIGEMSACAVTRPSRAVIFGGSHVD